MSAVCVRMYVCVYECGVCVYECGVCESGVFESGVFEDVHGVRV